MCGRFTLSADPGELAEYFQAPPMPWAPRYNIAPTQTILACRLDPKAGARELVPLRWGLVPAWAADLSAGVKAINARAETIAEKPFFRYAFHKRRCLIPASGFFEWQKTGKTKRPYYIHPADGSLFAFAGLWERWTKGEAPVETCTIITTTANAATQSLHERMPVILAPVSFAAWLDPATGTEAVQELLRPCLAERIAVYPVDARVGNVRNDDAGLIAPAGGLFPA